MVSCTLEKKKKKKEEKETEKNTNEMDETEWKREKRRYSVSVFSRFDSVLLSLAIDVDNRGGTLLTESCMY